MSEFKFILELCIGIAAITSTFILTMMVWSVVISYVSEWVGR